MILPPQLHSTPPQNTDQFIGLKLTVPLPLFDRKQGRLRETRALEERATQIRHLIETLDLLYDAFGQQRLSKEWSDTLPKMQKWLTREERRAA